MEFIEKVDNLERVYSVSYDSEKLEQLLDEIVKKCSYRISGEFTAPYNAEANFEKNEFKSGVSLPNGDSMYEDIESIYRYTSTGFYSYHNDSIGVKGTLVVPPELSTIISEILSEDPDSIYRFINYASHEELIPIDEKISDSNKKVDEISNFEVDKKIDELNRLKKLCEAKKAKSYFDVELLKQYYAQALSLFELHLTSEKTIKNGGRILLKDYKKQK